MKCRKIHYLKVSSNTMQSVYTICIAFETITQFCFISKPLQSVFFYMYGGFGGAFFDGFGSVRCAIIDNLIDHSFVPFSSSSSSCVLSSFSFLINNYNNIIYNIVYKNDLQCCKLCTQLTRTAEQKNKAIAANFEPSFLFLPSINKKFLKKELTKKMLTVSTQHASKNHCKLYTHFAMT